MRARQAARARTCDRLSAMRTERKKQLKAAEYAEGRRERSFFQVLRYAILKK